MHLERRHDTSRSFDEGRPPWLTTTAETEMGEGSAGGLTVSGAFKCLLRAETMCIPYGSV